MNLAFSTHWPDKMPGHLKGRATGFQEKIWKALYIEHSQDWRVDVRIPLFERPKIHTIRRDQRDRWQAGKKIHFVINPRSKNRKQFAPVINCISTQKISITYKELNLGNELIEVKIDDVLWKAFRNRKKVVYEWDVQLMILAQNDGFNTVEDFFSWFSEDFSGNIIHWTDHTY